MKKLLLLFFYSMVSVAAFAQWTTLSAPVTVDLHDVDFLTPDYGVIVGDQGNIHLTTDGGLTWSGINTSVPGSIYSVTLLNTDTFFVSTYNPLTTTGTLYVTTNAGLNWTPVASDFTSNHSLDLATNDFSNIFCDGSSLAVSDDLGLNNWDTLLTNTASIVSLFRLKFADAQTGVIAGNISGFVTYSCYFYRSEDSGQHWYVADLNSFLNSDALTAFCHVNADTVLLFNNDYNGFMPSNINNVVRLTNFAQAVSVTNDTVFTFTAAMLNPSMPAYINDAAFMNSNTGFAMGDNGSVYRTNDGGSTWSVDYNPGIPLFATDFVGTTGYAVGNDGLVIKYTNPVGLHQPEAALNFQLYPTVTNGELYLKFEGTESDYEISNNLGQVVERDKLYNGATTLDVGGFAKGVYNLRLWVGSAHQVKRFVVE